jgi:hypothetical protein
MIVKRQHSELRGRNLPQMVAFCLKGLQSVTEGCIESRMTEICFKRAENYLVMLESTLRADFQSQKG